MLSDLTGRCSLVCIVALRCAALSGQAAACRLGVAGGPPLILARSDTRARSRLVADDYVQLGNIDQAGGQCNTHRNPGNAHKFSAH
jgi:hypothetical protein